MNNTTFEHKYKIGETVYFEMMERLFPAVILGISFRINEDGKSMPLYLIKTKKGYPVNKLEVYLFKNKIPNN